MQKRPFTLKNTLTALFIAFALSVIAGPAAAQAQDSSFVKSTVSMASLYEYDRSMPLNVQQKALKDTADYKLYHVSFDGTNDKRVKALLAIPKSVKGPVPVVLFMHGYTGHKEDIDEGLAKMAPFGYACVSIDAEYHGERKIEGKQLYSKLVYSNRDGMIQTINDFRRAIDFIETRPKQLDAKRVGFIGGSMGGILGAVLTSVEPRIKASVLVVGGADWGYLLKASVVAEALGLNKGDDKVTPSQFAFVIAPADPINWAQIISPRPVLMLNGKHDMLVNPKANIYLYNRLKAPKKIVWFDEGHALPIPIALDYMNEFFALYLKGNTDPATLGEVITGHKTAPLGMELSKPLKAPVTEIPLIEIFNYDERLPLKTEVKKTGANEKYATYKVSFSTTHDKTITADLYIPAGAKAPYPAAIYLHELGADKSKAKNVFKDTVEKGYALLAIDMPYHGARKIAGRASVSTLIDTTRDAKIQTVIDIRRAIDFLASRNDVHWGGGIALFAAGKYSSETAIIAGAIDNRIARTALLPGENEAAYAKALSAIKRSGKMKAYEKAMKPLDISLYTASK